MVEQKGKAMIDDQTLRKIFRFAAVCSWITLTVLSLVPGRMRPHTGASGNIEHMMAYILAALVTRIAFRDIQTRWQFAVFSAAAASFEICQIWIPGRSAGVDNWAASTAGVLVGLLVAQAVVHQLPWLRWQGLS